MNAREEYERWLNQLPAKDPLRRELEQIRGKEDQIRDRFYQTISFGTAGDLRSRNESHECPHGGEGDPGNRGLYSVL